MLSKKRKGLVRDVRQQLQLPSLSRATVFSKPNPSSAAAVLPRRQSKRKRREEATSKAKRKTLLLAKADTERLMKATTKAVVIIHWDMNRSR